MKKKVQDSRSELEMFFEIKVRAALQERKVDPRAINTYVQCVYEMGDMEHDYEGVSSGLIYADYMLFLENGGLE